MVLFLSEIKCLFALPGINAEVNTKDWKPMHSFNYCPVPKTCFKNALSYGTRYLLAFRMTGKVVILGLALTRKQMVYIRRILLLLNEAIKLQMRFDVKGCSFLSGGVDSSVVTAHLKLNGMNKI